MCAWPCANEVFIRLTYLCCRRSGTVPSGQDHSGNRRDTFWRRLVSFRWGGRSARGAVLTHGWICWNSLWFCGKSELARNQRDCEKKSKVKSNWNICWQWRLSVNGRQIYSPADMIIEEVILFDWIVLNLITIFLDLMVYFIRRCHLDTNKYIRIKFSLSLLCSYLNM